MGVADRIAKRCPVASRAVWPARAVRPSGVDYNEFEKERDQRSFRRFADDREYAILYVKL